MNCGSEVSASLPRLIRVLFEKNGILNGNFFLQTREILCDSKN